MIRHSMADWPAVASSPTNLPVLLLRRIRHCIEMLVEDCATKRSSVAPANSLSDLTLDPARPPFRVRTPLRPVSIRSQLRRVLGPCTSRRS